MSQLDLFPNTTVHHIIYDDSLLSIAPSPKGIEALLEYTEKKMEEVPIPGTTFTRLVPKRYKVEMFKYISNEPFVVLQTYSGLLDKILGFLVENNLQFRLYDNRLKFPEPRLDLMTGFRFSQRELLTNFLLKRRAGLLEAPTRYGKCFGKGTPVLMADWTIKPIEEVRSGDAVMGPDSKPRIVAGCVRGRSEMFQVSPNYNGMSWTCNADHELHVQRTCETPGAATAGMLENVPVKDWLKSTKWFRHVRKQRRVALDHARTQLPLNPYIYGVWLGDGHSDGIKFTNAEPEVWGEVEAWADANGLLESTDTQAAGKAQTRKWVMGHGTGSVKKGSNKIRQWLRARKKSQGIDPVFIKTSREQRLELLAGLLDTDGESSGASNCGIISKYKKLAEDVAFLCQSLGFGASVQPCWKQAQTGPKRRYWRVGIRGGTDEISFRVPRKTRQRTNKFNCLTVGFEVESIGDGDYYGFALEDPEGLFLLGDCTVVHNTTLIKNILRAFPDLTTVVAIPGIDLVRQGYEDIKEALPHREVFLMGAGSTKKFPSDDITVCSMDSLDKCDTGKTRLVIVDEPHAVVTDSRATGLFAFSQARKFGLGATTEGRYDQRDIWIESLLGTKLVRKSYKEAVAEGAICPLVIYMLKIKFDSWCSRSRKGAYDRLLWKSERIAELTARICRSLIPESHQTLVFIKDENQAERYLKEIGEEGVIVMAKRMTSKERKAKMQQMQDDIIKRCLASKIYAQGVTFSDVRYLINVEGGGGSISSVQKPGRLAEIRPNKTCGVVFDFLFECNDEPFTHPPTSKDHKRHDGDEWWNVVRDSWSRYSVYVAKGYEVHMMDTWQQLKTHCIERVQRK